MLVYNRHGGVPWVVHVCIMPALVMWYVVVGLHCEMAFQGESILLQFTLVCPSVAIMSGCCAELAPCTVLESVRA